MNIRRISFIEAGSPCLHIFSKFPIPRPGAVLLSTILREREYEVKAFIEDAVEPDWPFRRASSSNTGGSRNFAGFPFLH